VHLKDGVVTRCRCVAVTLIIVWILLFGNLVNYKEFRRVTRFKILLCQEALEDAEEGGGRLDGGEVNA
jgi:hypothetical protein